MIGSGCKNCPVIGCETLNYRGSTCSAQRVRIGLGDPETNADRIRALVATDEGIAKILLALDISLAEDGREFTHLYCDGKNGCITEDDDIICTDEMRKACILRWLHQSAEAMPMGTIRDFNMKMRIQPLSDQCNNIILAKTWEKLKADLEKGSADG